MTLEIGKKAPAFNLSDKDNNKVALKDITTDYTVVYFYPKDNTPGCTIEAHEFSKLNNEFKKANTTIIGISGGDEKTKKKFCEKNKLTITLLSDTDNKVGEKYGVFGEKKFMGRTYQGYNRITFILDKNKKVIQRYDKVKPLIHAKEVLEFIKEQ
jgi:peroxiredoxin Q/BCP